MGDPGPVIASVAFFITVLGSILLIGPIGRAFADRLRGKGRERGLDSGEVEALRDEVSNLRRQVSELAERQDFAERLLSQVREKGLLQAPKER